MSTTQVIETSGEPPAATQVTAYVTAVRAALADLGPEAVEDLTGGTEADLTELLSERGGRLEQVLGPPGTYAAELRQAAGLPAAPVTSGTRAIDVGAWWSDRRTAVSRFGERRPWLRALWQFLVTLRPAWWVLRGLVAAWVLLSVFGIGSTPTYLMFSWALVFFGAPAVLGSVLLGRWSRRAWDRVTPPGAGSGSSAPARGRHTLARPLVCLGNVLAVIMALVGLGTANHDPVYIGSGAGAASFSGPGLVFEGQPVDNLYVYDAQGHRLTDVRLFGADGKSIVLDRTTDDTDPSITLPGRADVYGQWWTNVFPRPYTAYGDPYALSPSADPDAPLDGGASPWKPPPSVAPLVPSPTGPDPSAATSPAGGDPSRETTATTAPTTTPTKAPTTGSSETSTRPPTATPPVIGTMLPSGATVTATGVPTG